jgi:hypothetical protein
LPEGDVPRKKKNRDYVGKWKVPRVRCMTRRPKNKN